MGMEFRSPDADYLSNRAQLGGYAINDKGDIAGNTLTTAADGSSHSAGFLLQGSAFQIIPGLNGGNFTTITSLNMSDQVVGYGTSSSTGQQAPLWDNGEFFDLNSLIPASSGWKLNVATGINDAGQIAGYGTFNGQTQAFLLTPTTPTLSTPSPEPATLLPLLAGTALLLKSRPK